MLSPVCKYKACNSKLREPQKHRQKVFCQTSVASQRRLNINCLADQQSSKSYQSFLLVTLFDLLYEANSIAVNLQYGVYYIGLIANIVHISLNARGGGERLAVATIKAISSMGIGVELSTMEKPDMALIQNAYGIGIEGDIKKIKTLNIPQRYSPRGYGVTVNTHGDMLPFYHKDFTKKNAITYCHYPIARYLIDCADPDYSAALQNMCLLGMTPAVRNGYHDAVRSAYTKMMLNSTVLTN